MPQQRPPRHQPPRRPANDETPTVDFDPGEIDAAVDQLGATAQSTGEPVPDTLDACHRELKDTRRELDEMATEYSKVKEAELATRNELRELSAQTAQLAEENRALTRPPLGYALVVGLNEDDGTADVDKGSDFAPVRVAIHPRVERADLTVGQTVLLAPNSAILAVVEPRHIGRQMTIASVIDDKRVVVQGEGDRREIVRLSGSVDRARLEADTPVMVSNGFVTSIVTELGRSNPLGSASAYALAEMPDATFDDIGGLDEEVAEILAALEDPMLVPEGYDALKLKKTFSLLLFGLPGNGKTTIAKAIARHSFDKYREKILATGAKGNFIAVQGPELHSKWWGETEKKLRQIVAGAQQLHLASGAPVIIFLDDCESMLVSRGSTEHFTPNMDVVNQFNSLIEGVRELKGVSIIAATNRIDLMDAAVVSRFGAQKRINPPQTPKKATQVLQRLIGSVPFEDAPRDAVIESFVDYLFRKGPENEILEIHFEDDDDPLIVRLPELLSGRMLRDVVNRSKTVAKDRIKVLPPEKRVWALRSVDLVKALEGEFLNKESLPTTKIQVLDWLRQSGDKRDVDEVISLREYRKAEGRRDNSADRRVD